MSELAQVTREPYVPRLDPDLPRLPAWLANGCLGPVLLTAFFHAALLGAYTLAYHGDVSALVCADRDLIGAWPFEHVHVGFPAHGFDGQFYYVLARAPWQPQQAFIDNPAYRHVRILYPALAWALSGGGDPQLLLWVLPAINLAALIGLAWLGACIAIHYGRSGWWGFLLPIVLNAGMPALRDLTDPLATLTAVGLLTAWLLRWHSGWLAVWAVATVLSREQNALIVAIVMCAALLGRDWRRAGLLTGALFLLAGWVMVLHEWYGAWPTAPTNVAAPFVGMAYRWTHLSGLSGARSVPFHVVGMIVLSVQVLLSLLLVCRRAGLVTSLIVLAGAALAIFGGAGIYENGWSYSRVFWWMPVGIWLWSIQSGRCWPIVVMTPALMWPALAVLQAWS